MMMVDCPRCRTKLRDGARFCTVCGLPAAEIAAETERLVTAITSAGGGGATSDAHSGRVLDSKYELLEHLGEGGMGSVYRARRLHIGDEVAVKVLNERGLADRSAAERFRREARSAASIAHPNVVAIHDFSEGRPDGPPAYIVMELVRGESLRGLLKREGRLGGLRAVALMQDVCAGLAEAHRRGVIHRDLKPDNVIVVPPAREGEREVAKVVDFGIAKLCGPDSQLALTQTGALVGTPYYMSPEQCRGETLDARSDVYSLGAMLYEMLAGSPPFRADTIGGLISKHLGELPQPFPPGLKVSPALEAACLRALSKRPEERQADAFEFGRSLRGQDDAQNPADSRAPYHLSHIQTARAEAFGEVPARPKAETARLLKWAAAALALFAFAAVGASLAWFLWPRDDPDTGRRETARVDIPRPSPAQDTGSEVPKGSQDLKGEWVGTFGPLGLPATLTVEESAGGILTGILTQGSVKVAFTGSFDPATRRVTIKETRVLSGGDWSLGENSGSLSSDGRTMSGTGGDALGRQLGVNYQWSFTRH